LTPGFLNGVMSRTLDLEKLASQTALQRQGTRVKVLPMSAWPWLRARRGGTPHGGGDIRGHPVPQQ
jgi:hypothetical protein